MILHLPNSYKLNFEEGKDYKFSTENGKINLKTLLTKSSSGYCMYCYSRLEIDNKNFGHLEHTIEQNTVEQLKDCHYNISIACPTCNLSFKKEEQKVRKIIPENQDFFCKNINCKEEPCENFYNIADLYIKNMEDSKAKFLILKPRGVLEGENRKASNIIYYEISYDLLKFEFVPNKENNYEEKSKRNIEEHIQKFRLNDSFYKTKELFKLIEDVFMYKSLPKKGRYNNLICDLFIEFLESKTLNLNDEEKIKKILKICKIIEKQGLLTYRK